MIIPIKSVPSVAVSKYDTESESNIGTREQGHSTIVQAEAGGSPSEKMNGTSESEYSRPNYKELAAMLQKFLGETDKTIEFSIDEETKKLVMKVIDNKTQEVIQQLPPEVTLKIARIVASTLGNGKLTNAKV